ncbi:MAG: hypothetical protein K0R51_2635 [Cytophagaceae bacterium]|jgi:hypothetical protein|nr:hypothetical protein [Cytophagaceae bacterium]
MGVTRLKRKEKRNRAISTNKVNGIKVLTRKPVIKKVDVQELLKAAAAK